MKFKTYFKQLSKDDQQALADHFDTSVPYLYQLAQGYRQAGAKFLLGIEAATDGQVTPEELRDPASTEAA